jgi:hypothetical protein
VQILKKIILPSVSGEKKVEIAKAKLAKAALDHFYTREAEKILTTPLFRKLSEGSDVSAINTEIQNDRVLIRFYLTERVFHKMSFESRVEKYLLLSDTIQKIIEDHNNNEGEKDYLGLELKESDRVKGELNRVMVITLKKRPLNFWGTFGKYAPQGNSKDDWEVVSRR